MKKKLKENPNFANYECYKEGRDDPMSCCLGVEEVAEVAAAVSAVAALEEEEVDKIYGISLFIDPVTKVEDNSYQFGICKLELNNTPILKEDIDIHIMADISGSMEEKANHKPSSLSKQAYVSHVIKNIVTSVAEYNTKSATKISIAVTGFDDRILPIVEYTHITDNNFTDINKEIEKRLQPRGSTNIEKSLIHLNETTNLRALSHPNSIKNIIYLTDGHPTTGETNERRLSALVNKEVKTNFIGFGIDHKASTLISMASSDNCSYDFVPNIEDCPIIFAQILDSILYCALKNVKLIIIDGEIYNYNTNSWTQTLKIDNITSESVKTWHIRTRCDINQVRVIITCGDTVYQSTLLAQTNLNYEIHRYRTQELLFLAKQTATAFSVNVSRKIKFTLSSFLLYLKQYILDNQLEDNEKFKTLCDNIFIAEQTHGKKNGNVFAYSCSKYQGENDSYTINDISIVNNDFDMIEPPHKLQRGFSDNATPHFKNLVKQTSAGVENYL
jgi:hypothetical protein